MLKITNNHYEIFLFREDKLDIGAKGNVSLCLVFTPKHSTISQISAFSEIQVWYIVPS